jgi:predicted alpha/beta hydrolase family esterase
LPALPWAWQSLLIHSREDKSVPFGHAEWIMQNIQQAQLCEAGFTGHFIRMGPEYARIDAQMVAFV